MPKMKITIIEKTETGHQTLFVTHQEIVPPEGDAILHGNNWYFVCRVVWEYSSAISAEVTIYVKATFKNSPPPEAR